MGNLVCILAHCGRGDEIILGDQAHTFYYEQGGCAALGGVHPRPIPNQADGTLALKVIEAAVRPDNIHFPRTRLIALENTHNRCGGYPLTSEYMQDVRAIADRHHLSLHVDGARIFNAAVALQSDVAALAAAADSVTFCFSKGLAAPVGSMVCGGKDFIAEARRARKVLGGGMRQAGVLAAAGMVALTGMVDRLAEDHANARRLAEGLGGCRGILVDPRAVHTNIVYFGVQHEELTAQELASHLDAAGVRVLALGPNQVRAVTHYHVTADDIQHALAIFRQVTAS
jgi:threonine aldolase